MEQDVPRIHEVLRAYYAHRLLEIEHKNLELINPALYIARTRDRSTDASARNALDERFDALFARPESKVGAGLADLPWEATGQPSNEKDLGTIGDALDAVAPEVARFHDVTGGRDRSPPTTHPRAARQVLA